MVSVMAIGSEVFSKCGEERMIEVGEQMMGLVVGVPRAFVMVY